MPIFMTWHITGYSKKTQRPALPKLNNQRTVVFVTSFGTQKQGNMVGTVLLCGDKANEMFH